MEWFKNESDTKLLLFLQITEPFAALPVSNLILHLWKIKHDALQAVVMDERESITWTTQQKSHRDSRDKNISFNSLPSFPFRLQLQWMLPLAII